MARPGDRVTVCIPYFRARKYIRRAVESMLNQTYSHLTVVVINDGDPEKPWDQLSQISDPRLVRFDLPENRGPFFATAVVLNACLSPYLLIQDSDDWSTPDRLQKLLDKLRGDNCDFVGSSLAMFKESANGNVYFSHFARFAGSPLGDLSRLGWRLSHHGLWKCASLRALGGYYGGLRLSYDLFLTNAISILGKARCLDLPLYFRVARPTSMTVQANTAIRSKYRIEVERVLESMYQEIVFWRNAFLLRRISKWQLAGCVRAVTARHIDSQTANALSAESHRLRSMLVQRSGSQCCPN